MHKLLECLAKLDFALGDGLIWVSKNVQYRVYHLTNNGCWLDVGMVVENEEKMNEIYSQTKVF